MGQLSRVASATRKVIKYGALGLVAYIILSFAFKFAIQLWRQLNPPPGPPPTVAFGKLQPISFPDSATNRQFGYRLETPTGTFPVFPDQAAAYAVPPHKANLLSLDRLKGLAIGLGFPGEPTRIAADRYRFTQPLPALLTLEIDLIYQTFFIQYQWQNDETILLGKQFGDPGGLKGRAKSKLAAADVLAKDLEDGSIEITYLKAVANALVPAVSLSEADFIRFDFYRQNRAFPFVPAHYDKANVNLILSGSSDSKKQVISLEYAYFPIDYNSVATYPLKSVDTAWEELKQGKGYIARVKPSAPEGVAVRRVFLAFYDPAQYQPFVQPVYVFQGDDNFVAYVPAVSSEWLK